eukprot:gene3602-13684_t
MEELHEQQMDRMEDEFKQQMKEMERTGTCNPQALHAFGYYSQEQQAYYQQQASNPGMPQGDPKYQRPPQEIVFPQGFQGSPENVAEACKLVTSAVEDIHEAVDALHKKGGLIAAAKTGLSGAASGQQGAAANAGKTIIHDPRQIAVMRVKAGHAKYEKAATMVEGMPQVQLAQIKQGIVQSAGNKMYGDKGGKVGGGIQGAVGAGAGITTSVLGAAQGASLISRVVQKKRIEKAVPGVMAMKHEYEAVQRQLAKQMQANGSTPPSVGQERQVHLTKLK